MLSPQEALGRKRMPRQVCHKARRLVVALLDAEPDMRLGKLQERLSRLMDRPMPSSSVSSWRRDYLQEKARAQPAPTLPLLAPDHEAGRETQRRLKALEQRLEIVTTLMQTPPEQPIRGLSFRLGPLQVRIEAKARSPQ